MKQISIIQQLHGQPIVVACDSPLKVWLKVIANSPSCLSLDSQVIDHILIDVLDKRYFLTSEIELLISLYSLDRSSSDTEPSSTEGSSWGYSSEPGTEDSWAGPQLIYPPVQALFLFLGNRFIDLLRLESLFPFSVSPPLAGRFIDLLMEIQYHWVSPCFWDWSLSFLSLSLLLLLERI
jgi:hypothetical protein